MLSHAARLLTILLHYKALPHSVGIIHASRYCLHVSPFELRLAIAIPAPGLPVQQSPEKLRHEHRQPEGFSIRKTQASQ
jgi:hypothetical protein